MENNKFGLMARLPLIRMVMLTTLLLISAMMLVFHRQNEGTLTLDQFDPAMVQIVNLGFLVFIFVTGIIVLIIRNKLEGDLADPKRAMLVLAAWAAGEGVAMFGAVLIMFGITTYFIAGMITFGMILVVVPIPESRESR